MAGGNLSLRDSLLPAVDAIRGIPGLLGLRPHIVQVRRRTWTGNRPGFGVLSDFTTGIKVDFAVANVKVRNVSQKEVIASAGQYTDQDLVVGPLTPPFAGSQLDNDAISVFDPPVTNTPSEIFFLVQGPGYLTAGDWFKKIAQRTDQSFRYMFWLRKTGEQFA